MRDLAHPRSALRLLGGFRLTGPDGAPVALPTKKTRLLLAWLAVSPGEAHGRERLAALLWPDRAPEQARGSLRAAVAALRAALGPETILADRETVTLAPAALATDVDALAARAADPDPADPEAALNLPLDEFLAGVAVEEGELADWLSFERVRRRAQAQEALHAAACKLGGSGRAATALPIARRLLALDPLREQSHALLMRVHAAMGDRSLALTQFEACRELLRRELGVEPSPETARAARDIAEGRWPPPAGEPPEPAPPPSARAFTLSLAVLPFANPGGDPADAWLAEGLAEDVLTELTRRRDFLVIARSSSFPMGAEADPAESARALGVRYALAGAARRAGDRLRVTVRLIDAAGGRAVWAERYDAEMADVFAVQDAIVRSIVGALDARMRENERESAARKPPESLDAWELHHRGLWRLYRMTREDVAEADALFARAVAAAPDFALPHGGRAAAAFVAANWGFAEDVRAAYEAGLAHGERAVALDPDSAFCLNICGRLMIMSGRAEAALPLLRRAVEANPSYAPAYMGLAQGLYWTGRPAEALPLLDEGLVLNPRDPNIPMFTTLRAYCLMWLGELDAAAAVAREAVAQNPRYVWSRLALAAAEQARGRAEAAAAVVGEARAVDPGLTLARFAEQVRHAPADERDRVLARLAAAGLG